MTSWEEFRRLIVDAEREFVRKEGRRTVLRGMSPLEMLDAAHEDPQGRLPCDPDYDTGGEVVELPVPPPPRTVVVGDIFDALREFGRAVRR